MLQDNSNSASERQASASQGGGGGGNTVNNTLANSFKSDVFARMSSDEFERASEDAILDRDGNASGGGGPNSGAKDRSERIKPVLATPENTACYNLFANHPVRVEGPEFNQDFTYYLVHKQ